ncbi:MULTISPECIES: TIGR01459 family HAD-type hydrolase [Kordiimonas]|jgi:HAD superfamily hydrolase (TIGR01459 family)|uniref:TIGR01459 family HAD-type hydrolase n=1 Tax=Kordiimonas TaxID=288021 RepID=UPI00257E5BAD|nr:TIGR01459 family HAD-type hydrolase [Kordiimonas sp. UBA4487]
MPNSSGTSVHMAVGLREVIDETDLVICDLWGVMHDGLRLHADAVEAIQRAREAGVRTVFLSNAPRPRTHVRDHLMEMGLPTSLTDFVVTSGGLARDEVRERFTDARLYHVGPEGDRNTVEGLPVTDVDHPDEADIILATDLDFQDVEAHGPWLRAAAERGVPFLCANPDRIVHVGERLYPCAGAVADLYASMGGDVHWFGKPTPQALQSCLKEVGMDCSTPGSRVLMVGDSLQTDMAGASAAGYRGLFITGGIHRDEAPLLDQAANKARVPVHSFRKIFGEEKAVPHAVMQALKW